MPDVSLIQFDSPFVADGTVPIKRASAFAWIKHALSMTELIEPHFKEMLKIGIWKWTVAAGVNPNDKYNQRYISDGVLHPSAPASMNHEHVWTQKFHHAKLRSRRWSDEELRAYLEEFGVACMVTVDEHARLGGQAVEGWERYSRAGIRVWDRAKQDWAEFGGSATTVEQPTALAPATVQHDGSPVSIEVNAQIVKQSTPAIAPLLLDFIATARNAGAVETPSYKETGEPSRYFRVHDALIGEPTAAVAFTHWSGRVAYRVQLDDLPASLRDDQRTSTIRHARYGVQVKITDASSLVLASAVLMVALEKLRDPYEI